MSKLVEALVTNTGLNAFSIERLIDRAPRSYKTYDIPKRSGGVRRIAQPAREIKALQRAFAQEYLAHLPVHEAAKAYKKGAGIKDNASPHAHGAAILKLDFRNFFPSIRAMDWVNYCEEHSVFSDKHDINLSASLLFYRSSRGAALTLAIGAPSSPILSNIIMYKFDTLIANAVAEQKVVYTRYADDITFSADRAWNLRDAKKIVAQTIRNISYPKLDINDSKTVVATKKYRRTVTGLVLANDGRVTIGKDKKRQLRASVHHFREGRLGQKEAIRLSGYLAYVHSVEPAFLSTLARVYTADLIQRILSHARYATQYRHID